MKAPNIANEVADTANRRDDRCDRVLENRCGECSEGSNTEALEHTMRKIPMTIAAASIVAAAIAAPTKAEARWWGGGWRGAGIAAGGGGGGWGWVAPGGVRGRGWWAAR